MREVAGFQSEGFNGDFRERSVRFDLFIRGHHGCDDCDGSRRISFGYEEN